MRKNRFGPSKQKRAVKASWVVILKREKRNSFFSRVKTKSIFMNKVNKILF